MSDVTPLRGDDATGLAVHIEDLVVASGLTFSNRGTHVLNGVPDAWQAYAAASS